MKKPPTKVRGWVHRGAIADFPFCMTVFSRGGKPDIPVLVADARVWRLVRRKGKR